MPKNRVIYIGVLIIAAVAVIYLAKEFTQFVAFILPWALGLGVLLVLAGVMWEAKKSKDLTPGETAATGVSETKV